MFVYRLSAVADTIDYIREGTPPSPEMRALLALSRDVVERVVWEVVPDLAESIIRENLDQLVKR